MLTAPDTELGGLSPGKCFGGRRALGAHVRGVRWPWETEVRGPRERLGAVRGFLPLWSCTHYRWSRPCWLLGEGFGLSISEAPSEQSSHGPRGAGREAVTSHRRRAGPGTSEGLGPVPHPLSGPHSGLDGCSRLLLGGGASFSGSTVCPEGKTVSLGSDTLAALAARDGEGVALSRGLRLTPPLRQDGRPCSGGSSAPRPPGPMLGSSTGQVAGEPVQVRTPCGILGRHPSESVHNVSWRHV